ncbi:unnamed protein product, partial [Didymodactylos carnosus]
MHNPRGLPLQ